MASMTRCSWEMCFPITSMPAAALLSHGRQIPRSVPTLRLPERGFPPVIARISTGTPIPRPAPPSERWSQPANPVMNGVTAFNIGSGYYYGGYSAEVSLAPGATDIADLTSGYSLAAEMTGFPGRIIGLNFFPPSSNVASGSWPATGRCGCEQHLDRLGGAVGRRQRDRYDHLHLDGARRQHRGHGNGHGQRPWHLHNADRLYAAEQRAQVTGVYQWNASYSGDANNSPASDNNDPAEQVTVSPAQPTLVGTPSPTTAMLGPAATTLTDSAVLSGGYNETGTITFTLTAPDGSTVDTETIAVNGDGTYTTPIGYALSSGSAGRRLPVGRAAMAATATTARPATSTTLPNR